MAKEKREPKLSKYAGIFTAVLVILGFALLYLWINLTAVGGLVQLIMSLYSLFIVGMSIQKLNNFKGGYGGYIAGTSHGLDLVDKISKKAPDFWEAMATWGLVVGLGVLSYPLMKNKISKKMYAFGIISLVFILLFVIPEATTAYQFINIPQVAAAAASRPTQAPTTINFIQEFFSALTVLTGVTGFLFGFIIYNAGNILYSTALYLLSVAQGQPNTSNLTTQVPGVALILPGLGIPFAAGIAAFAIIIIVHEFSHGILARVWKVKLKQMGLLLFGIIPIGAFVEPDEKQVSKLDVFKQTKIFSAGIASNFLVMAIFFFIVYAMQLYAIPYVYSNQVLVGSIVANTPAYGILKPGMWIQSWNGQNITSIQSLITAAAPDAPNQIVTVVANGTPYSFKAIAQGNSTHGIIGLANAYQPISSALPIQAEYFIYIVLSLSLLFNLLIGAANLFPLPLFDGWRIYQINVKSKKLVKWVGIVLIAAFIINALPWLYI